jgi:hypothetical protein
MPVVQSLRGMSADRKVMITSWFNSLPGRPVRFAALVALAVAAGSLTGCQVDVGGQTLPSAYYLQDDIQYFPAGPEFKLSKEAAALKAHKKEMGDTGGCNNCGHCASCR